MIARSWREEKSETEARIIVITRVKRRSNESSIDIAAYLEEEALCREVPGSGWLFLAHRGSIKASKARISMRHPVRRGSYFQVGVQARLPSTWDVVRNAVAQAARVPTLTMALLPRSPSGRLLPLPVFTRSRTKSTRITWLFAPRE